MNGAVYSLQTFSDVMSTSLPLEYQIMKFLVDKAQIHIKAGNGGPGSGSFRREKYIPKGGPDGGDGGNGGSVYLVGDHNMATLMDFRGNQNYTAEHGKPGTKKKCFGKYGEDLTIKVPIGTLVFELVDGKEKLMGDIVEDNKPFLVARGGRGGLGNVHFKSSVNQAPTKFTKGTRGEEKDILLEVKLVADVGLIGMPNAGKSTLINQLTGAKVKIENYPFTTLVPNLARYRLKSGQEIIIADIPGLIEGASKGKGIGDDFLRHIERTRVLVHLVDPLSFGAETIEDYEDPNTLIQNALRNYEVIRKELDAYGAELAKKPEIVVLNKTDVTEIANALYAIKLAFKKINVTVTGISAFSGAGIESLDELLIKVLSTAPEKLVFRPTEKVIKRYSLNNLPNRRVVQ